MKKRILLCAFLVLLVGLAAATPASAVLATERLYLSGRDGAEAVPWEFRCSAGAKAGEWAAIPVPSNWEMHGFGTLSYHSVTPGESSEYRQRFTLPAAWQGRRIRIVFDGVMTDTRVTVNGQSAGPMHQGGFYRFSYDVGALVRFGEENILEVAVDETSANEGVNKAERTGDYWNFGGIYRPVWLEAVPTQALERVAINARADGSFSLDAYVDGSGDATQVEVRIVDAIGREVAPAWHAPLADGQARVTGRVASPALWSGETPVLHTAETRLLGPDGMAVHQLRTRFGFRTFEVRKGDGFYLNGQRVVLQGANRHSFNASSGRCLSEADHREDIRLMKEMNATAVRMSHYPPDERFLELCDEEGLYVLDELAGWQKSYDMAVGRARLEAMVTRDVNHPSVVLWDNGNEGGWNTELDGDFAKWDPQGRAVLHPWQVFSGVNTAHYRIYPQLAALVGGLEPAWRYAADDVPKQHAQPLIYLPTEFLHGLFDGGAGAGMEDYWTAMRAGKYFGGGFVWAWMDEGVRRPDTGKIDVMGNQAPDGILGPRREKEASFYTLKELWSPVVVQERVLPESFRGALTIENRFGFTNTAACRFVWMLRRMPSPGAGGFSSEETVASGIATAPDVAPGSSGALVLELPDNWRAADVLALRIEDPRGRELWTTTWALPGLKRLEHWSESAKAVTKNATVVENAGEWVVTAGDVLAKFSRTTGGLVELGNGKNKLPLGDGVRALMAKAELIALESRTDGTDVVVMSRYTGGLRSVKWRVRANGWIDCEYTYAGMPGSAYQGVGFDLPGVTVRSKAWVGEGPYRVWQNRRRGVSVGAWSNAYNETVTGWSGFEYPEFKGCFAGVHWLTLDTANGRLTVVPKGDNLFVQVMKPDLPPAELRANTDVTLPEVTIGLLHVIPAIGTKFTPPEKGGPQGVVPEAKAEYAGAFSLRLE